MKRHYLTAQGYCANDRKSKTLPQYCLYRQDRLILCYCYNSSLKYSTSDCRLRKFKGLVDIYLILISIVREIIIISINNRKLIIKLISLSPFMYPLCQFLFAVINDCDSIKIYRCNTFSYRLS